MIAHSLDLELAVARDLARAAGAALQRHRAGPLEVGYKARGEIVTAADLESDRIIRDGLAIQMSDEDWGQVIQTNLTGTFAYCRAAALVMMKKRTGSIINMSSCIAEIGLARRVSYAASKGAVFAMTKSMQVDVAQHGIRVNALLPGTILTPFVERYLKESYSDPEEGMASIRRRQLSNDLGRPEDVAQAALFLASDESKFMMAAGLIIDGGITGAR